MFQHSGFRDDDKGDESEECVGDKDDDERRQRRCRGKSARRCGSCPVWIFVTTLLVVDCGTVSHWWHILVLGPAASTIYGLFCFSASERKWEKKKERDIWFSVILTRQQDTEHWPLPLATRCKAASEDLFELFERYSPVFRGHNTVVPI